MKALELHYPMIQFLIKYDIRDKNPTFCLQTVLITAGPGVKEYHAS